MSVFWLRSAAALYSCGLLYALFYVFRKSTRLFPLALTAFGIGTVLHLVSIIELRAETGHLPLNNFYETSSTCAFLIAVLFLVAYSYFHISIFGVCLFPIVFFMTLIGATEFPVSSWSNPEIRNAWLVVHVATVLIGYAALTLAAVASVYYLLQERQLKSKNVAPSSNRLPPLATLDRVITLAMNTGFVFITIGALSGVVWVSTEIGRRWVLDLGIWFFLFTWAFYLAMIFLRLSAGWRGRRMAWLAVSVLSCSIITWVAHVGLRTVWLP
ncbi:MAG: cytochrome c biogenesis protein CcsA [Acidobacteriaceae bacterium]|nr:cytochrome c biogenesis protein CcsA [Acidobacteriaceae bacterium]MBV9780506.1 cytochrome c biogenesis protein CcsA [Acidobacteriaceae bacterium]